MKSPKPLITLLILVVILIGLITLAKQQRSETINFGVTFSDKYAVTLSLDPELVLDEILNDLKVKNFRLPIYWDEIEKEEGNFDFSKYDSYVNKISAKQGRIVIVTGLKVPRWPECHPPTWTKNLDKKELQNKQLLMIQKVVEHYDKNPSLVAWQIENEPFVDFGVCSPTDKHFFEEEISLVRTKTFKPIIITDSGEFGTWITPAKFSNFLGISLYRTTYNPHFGIINHPIPPEFYVVKSFLIRNIFAPNNQNSLIMELQAEPWIKEDLRVASMDDQIAAFPPTQLRNNANYAKQVGFKEAYFWGVEWWYFMKQKGNPNYWDTAKEIF